MTTLRMVNAIAYIDEDLIAEAMMLEKKNHQNTWLSWIFSHCCRLCHAFACYFS